MREMNEDEKKEGVTHKMRASEEEEEGDEAKERGTRLL